MGGRHNSGTGGRDNPGRNVIVAYDGPGFRDIDSARMVLRVEEGKGRKGRYAMLFGRPVFFWQNDLRVWGQF